ncbi:SCO2525 family SAM-dependent methyltransferase [Micromonospora sp. DT62]|uniref:SCO2525 family SAM-dependent methyltransferase n=1 Tax=Micromonospora sp. DT62 TaxID=3416521 RepID=UPI003CEDB715
MASTPVDGSACQSEPAGPSQDRSGLRRNSEIDWDTFDPWSYLRSNYVTLRTDDREILRHLRDFFVAADLSDAHCLDAGSGANLYPALAMLPFAENLDLCEWSAANVGWLRSQLDGYDASWDPFWRVCAEQPAYSAVADPRRRLAQVGRVRRMSVFDLPARSWDAGTMFFVACSISSDSAEFEHAVGRFLGALRPGSPFAAAFMLGSQGYSVGGHHFPAVTLRPDNVAATVGAGAYDLALHEVRAEPPLREEDLSMLLVTGRTHNRR